MHKDAALALNSEIGGKTADARRHVKADRLSPRGRSANKLPPASIPAKMATAGTPFRILALDLAVHTGFAEGLAGSIPESGVIRLKRPADGPEIAAFTIAAWLRERIGDSRPDLVIVEAYLPPGGHKSADSIIIQYMIHGAVHAFCRCHDIRIESISAPTIRKHFCGRAHAGERSETKLMIIRRAQALNYLPRDCMNDNQADAIAAWSYAECHFCRIAPKSLVLFGEGAAA